MKKVISILLFCLIAINVYSQSKLSLYQDMIVTENLRLRTTELDGRKIITVLKEGSRVKIIDIDETSEEIIDGIKSKWVKVEVQPFATDRDGKEIKYGVVGWCFAGYLKEVKNITCFPEYKNGNGDIISRTNNGNQIVEIRKHNQKIIIGDLAGDEDRKVYSSINKSNMIYMLRDNEEIEISEIHDIKDLSDNKRQVWLKVNVKENTGFIYYGKRNPYENNRMEILEEIKLPGKTWTARKLTQSLAVFSNEDKVELRDNPGLNNTNVIDYVPASYKNGQGQVNFEIEAITEELDSENGNNRWVRVSYNGKTGWICGKYLSAERGGPTYYIPEDWLSFSYGWY